MNRISQFGLLLAHLVGILFLLAACGPAVQSVEEAAPAETAAETSEAATAEPTQTIAEPGNDSVEAAAEEVAPATGSALEIAEELSDVDESGIQVGFTADGHPYRGDPKAPVVIEEFSDFQCPFCNHFFQETLPGLEANYLATGEAVLILYEFPLESLHAQARAASEAARCAGEQGAVAYWQMHDRLFGNAQEWAVASPETIFTSYAADLGLDADAFEQCQADNKHEQAINADLADGIERGVRGTPTFFINGQVMVGAQPVAVFDQAIAQVEAGQPIAAAGAGSQPVPTVSPDEVEVPPPAEFSDEIAATLGDPEAPVTIVEFTDYECPFCARYSQETLPRLRAEYIDTGQVYYIIKDLPLDEVHPKARAGAAAARCAGEQNGYWTMHDELFAQQERWATAADTNAALVELAGELTLDIADFAACLESGRYDEAIQANLEEAAYYGANGTPSFFIQGYPAIQGAQPYEQFEFIIDLALNDKFIDALREALAAAETARQQQAQQQPQGPTGRVDVPIGDAPFIGDPEAPVTIVEYTDYECPFCARHFNETYGRIIENYVATGQVRYVVKDFPLTDIHPQAALAAEAARCAREQNAWREMHDALFAGQQAWANNEAAGSIFTSYAGELGLDVDSFQSCLESHKYQEAVMSDLAEGSGFGVNGTPGFFINGRFISGAQPYNVFENAIEQALAEAE